MRATGFSEIWALRDVSFDVERGQSVGLIGRNGSGKSTLLEIITGTLAPTTGSVGVKGRIAALLELGSGFNPEYTGRENVLLNGLILGLTKDDIEAKFDDIVAFADVGDVLDRPVKTYSSGMLVRLAFAVQTAINPDILIVDEALSVGDFFFQQKCLARIRALQEAGTTILFVSHDMQIVRDLCQKGMLLRDGHVAFWGDNRMAINKYLARQPDTAAAQADHPAPKATDATSSLEPLAEALWTSLAETGTETRILAVGVYDETGSPRSTAKIGDVFRIRVRYQDAGPDYGHIALALRNRFNQILTSVSTYTHGVSLPRLKPGETGEAVFEVECQMEAGEYALQLNIGRITGASIGDVLDETTWLGPLRVTWDYSQDRPPFFGLCGLPVTVRCRGNG